MRRILLFILAISLYGTKVAGQQTWQWGKSGGSSLQSFNNNYEQVLDIATDKWGNSYFLANIHQGSSMDGNPLSGFGSRDIVISSFSCDGTYRWSKVLGTPIGNDDFHHIETDTLGGVYIAGVFPIANMYTANIGTDTSVANTNKSMMLIKFDTAGAYQWLRMPQADTVSIGSITYTRPCELDVDKSGDIYWLCQLQPGAYADGAFIVNAFGVYMLQYNAQGIFQSGVQVDMQATGAAIGNIRMKRDHANGRLYLSGSLPSTGGDMILGGVMVTHERYAAGFNVQGQHLWTQEGTAIGNSRFHGRAEVDDSGNVYIAGVSQHGDGFAGYTVVNTFTTGVTALPFIVKLDSNGNLQWANHASVNGASYGEALTLRSNDEVVITGHYPGTLLWQGYTGPVPNHIGNQGYDIFITRFNAHTGSVISIDTIGSAFGESDRPSAIATDASGGILVGGRFEGTLFIGTADTLYNQGGESDLVLARFGYPCGCIPPSADLNYALSGWNGTFTYTGTSQYDSLRWYFGDGGTSTQTNPAHTYTTNGNYTVCVTAYNACDSNQYCETIQVTVGVNTVAGVENISVYPNPATELLQVKGLQETTQYRLLNITGAVMQQGVLEPDNKGISTLELAPGMYLLELNNKQQQGVVRVMKQ